MAVYAIVRHNYGEGDDVVAVFTTRELAEEKLALMEAAEYTSDTSVEEYDVLDAIDPQERVQLIEKAEVRAAWRLATIARA